MTNVAPIDEKELLLVLQSISKLNWGTNKCTVIVDTHETKSKKETAEIFKLWFNKLRENNINVLFQTLDVGDIWILLNDKVLFVFERKSMSDLSTSIQTKRKDEQCMRLQELSLPPSHKFFIIENGTVHKDYFVGWSRIFGSITNFVVRDHVGVLRTMHRLETLYLLFKFVLKCNEYMSSLLFVIPFLPTKEETIDVNWKPPQDLLQSPSSSDIANISINEIKSNQGKKTTKEDYLKAVCVKKSANLTPETALPTMLSQIPGVSMTKALAIGEVFPSIKDLCNLTTDPNAFISCISEIHPPSQKRAIGTKIAKKILSYCIGKPLLKPQKPKNKRKTPTKPKKSKKKNSLIDVENVK